MMGGGEHSLKSLPVRNTSVFVMIMRGGLWKSVTVKRVLVALSLRGTVNSGEWSSGPHD